MLLRLAEGLRRFFKFSHQKNRLPVEPIARPVCGQEGKEKISEGDKCEPKGSQKIYDSEKFNKEFKRELLIFNFQTFLYSLAYLIPFAAFLFFVYWMLQF